ncbi:MAG: Holliday junction branch migration protein RuvA [Betaproteobacteria bacterium]|nr:Holliday junction branch migration protein RuvA [Betaproteobacteria bacterium]
MIGRLAGTLVGKQPPTVVIDVQGVGYEVDVPMSTFYQLPANGANVTLRIQMIVREDAHLLYGFASEGERQAFRQLLKVSGIGPRTALSVLSGMTVDELYRTIAAQETARLTRVPGIGRKTAERLLLELKDKLAPVAGSHETGTQASARGDALNALVSLGYNEREAAAALAKVDSALPAGDAIRQALRQLSKVL